jgi:D-serine deaminase-like pyridoxal phosphate-dependent protein
LLIKVLVATAGSALASYMVLVALRKWKRTVDPTIVDPSCPQGNCPIVPQPILDAVARIERSEHRDPFAAIESGASLGDTTTGNHLAISSARGARGSARGAAAAGGAGAGRLRNNPVPLEFPLPTVLVDLASFQHNVRAMARIALASGKKVRIGTKSLRVPALIQLAADVIEAEGLAMFQEHLADRRASAATTASAAGAAASLAGFVRVDELDDETADLSQRAAFAGGSRIAMAPQQQQNSAVAGLMTYSAAETLFWAKRIASGQAGATFSSLLLAYPVADAYSAHLFVDAMFANAAQRVVCSVVVDAEPQLLMLADAAMRAVQQERYLSVDGFDGAGAVVEVHVVLDIDMSYRPFAASSLLPADAQPHLGIRRSPLRTPEDVSRMLRLIADTNERCSTAMRHERVGLRFRVDGFMGYEAQVAGVQDLPFDASPTSLWSRASVSMMHWFKKRSMGDVVARRKDCLLAIEHFLQTENAQVNHHASPIAASEQLSSSLTPLMTPQLMVNGGGSGSIQRTARDPSVTEITIGSGALCGHLFDRFVSCQSDEPLQFLPAIFIALGVNRIAEPPRSRSKMHQGVVMAAQIVCCHGGGYIASGAVGGGVGVGDRAPIVVHPPFGMSNFTSTEGFGEVQTPFVQHCCVVAPGQDSSVLLSNSLHSATMLNTLGRFNASASLPPSASVAQCAGAPRPSPLNMLPLTIGDVVLLRPAKSGEIAEHFDEYLLVDSAASAAGVSSLVSPLSGSTSSDAPFANSLNIVGGRHVFGTMHRVPTYRGFGSLAS